LNIADEVALRFPLARWIHHVPYRYNHPIKPECGIGRGESSCAEFSRTGRVHAGQSRRWIKYQL